MRSFSSREGISQARLASDIGVDPRRINEIVHGHRAITADLARRLGEYFGNSARFWLDLQAQYDNEMKAMAQDLKLENRIKTIESNAGYDVIAY